MKAPNKNKNKPMLELKIINDKNQCVRVFRTLPGTGTQLRQSNFELMISYLEKEKEKYPPRPF